MLWNNQQEPPLFPGRKNFLRLQMNWRNYDGKLP